MRPSGVALSLVNRKHDYWLKTWQHIDTNRPFKILLFIEPTSTNIVEVIWTFSWACLSVKGCKKTI